MPPTPQETATALAHISALKSTQKGTLAALSMEALAARKVGDHARARSLTRMSVTLRQHNMTIHNAKQKALRKQNLGAVNSQLKAIAAQSDQIRKDLNSVVDTLSKAAQFIDLVRRTIDVLT